MQANWSLILNVLLLIGVIAAIARLMKARKQSLSSDRYQPAFGKAEKSSSEVPFYNDDIIAVRKVNRESLLDIDIEPEPESQILKKPIQRSSPPKLIPEDEPIVEAKLKSQKQQEQTLLR